MKNFKLYTSSIRLTLQDLKDMPVLYKPFLYLAVIELIGLVLFYFSAQYPFKIIFAPFIKSFYGEAVLHYPYDLVILPKVFRLWQVSAGIIFGSLLAGITISMYNQQAKNMAVRFNNNFKIAFRRYSSLFVYTAAVFILIYGVDHYSKSLISTLLLENKGYFLKMGQLKWGIILQLGNFLFNVLVKAAFIYVPIIIVIEDQGFWQSAVISLKTFSKYTMPSLIVVFVPILFYLGIETSRAFIPQLVITFFPEVSFWIVLLGIIAGFFVNVILAVSSTVVYLEANKPVKEKAPIERVEEIRLPSSFVAKTLSRTLPKETSPGTGRKRSPGPVKRNKRIKGK
jgi:hypothetical protein